MDVSLEPPLLVFGGPYSNSRALRAVRERASEFGITADHCFCTGDVVAYCTEPEETTAAIRDWGCHVIAGNCEEQLAAGAADCGCGFEAGTECDRLARSWYEFANRRISPRNRDWMAGLASSLRFTVAGFTAQVIHGGVTLINRFVFPSERATVADELERTDADIVIAGHCGIPFIERVGRRVWFNPGAIGMPANDGTPDTWFGLIRSNAGSLLLSTHRLAYDYRGAAAAMRGWRHADPYVNALETGLWPSLEVLPEPEKELAGRRIREATLQIMPHTLLPAAGTR